jgi:hypothetical protein
MSYRVQFEGPALVQLNGLPSPVFDALVERVVALVDEPWDADLMTAGGDPAFRQTICGTGYGLITFRVDEAAEQISIFDIAWIG